MITVGSSERTPPTYLVYGGLETPEYEYGRRLMAAYEDSGVASGMHIFADQERHFFSNENWPEATTRRAFEFLEEQKIVGK